MASNLIAMASILFRRYLLMNQGVDLQSEVCPLTGSGGGYHGSGSPRSGRGWEPLWLLGMVGVRVYFVYGAVQMMRVSTPPTFSSPCYFVVRASSPLPF